MKIAQKINAFNETKAPFDWVILFFRIAVSLQLIVVHGLKKIGIGTGFTEAVPNPYHLPENINFFLAVASNIFFPILIIIGWKTRWATLPVLAVTLSGYFIVHWNDSLLESDVPFMYSIAFLLIAFLGAGKYSLDFVVSKKRSILSKNQ
ncbi:DoxX family protein [Flavobacterium enshiense]|uniref:DoxX family protein n=1 Tax=Flavobacterium enshiense TaxID=1341165 RepID=UPI00345C6B65